MGMYLLKLDALIYSEKEAAFLSLQPERRCAQLMRVTRSSRAINAQRTRVGYRVPQGHP